MGAEGLFERLEGRSIDGRFTLDRFVACGGSGAVYRGRHLALGCPVAIKVLAVSEHDRHVSRRRFIEAFEREAHTVAALRHPAVVRVLDSGVTDVDGEPHPFMVFEWIDGVTLDVHLREAAGLRRSPREALSLLRPVFGAIACAHEAGVIHRDIKPSNVMVVPPDGGAITARVLDFGVAKVVRPDDALSDTSERTTDEFSSFTLSHAAPEQVGRLRTGPWTDVHALALLVVELLVGERAYRGATTIDLFARITSNERPTPRAFGLRVGPWESELDRALALDPRERHADAGALLRALEDGLDGAQRAWELSAAPVVPAPAASATRRRAAVIALAALAACAAIAAWRFAPISAPAPHVAALSAQPPTPAPPITAVARTVPVALLAPPAAAPAPPLAPRRTVLRPAPRLAITRVAPRRAPDDGELAIE